MMPANLIKCIRQDTRQHRIHSRHVYTLMGHEQGKTHSITTRYGHLQTSLLALILSTYQ